MITQEELDQLNEMCADLLGLEHGSSHPVARMNPLLFIALWKRLRALEDVCSCGSSYEVYEGPQPDCAVHGAVTAMVKLAQGQITVWGHPAQWLHEKVHPVAGARAYVALDDTWWVGDGKEWREAAR